MKKSKFLLTAISLLFFISCSNRPHNLVNPEWTTKPESYTVLYTEPFIINQIDLEDDLAEYKDNFSTWFENELSSNLKNLTGIQPNIKKITEDSLDIQPLKYTESFNIPVPFLKSTDNLQGVVFIIHPTQTNREMDKCYRTRCDNLPNNKFIMGSFFSAHDVSKKELLAYGDISAIQTFHFALTKSDWENAIAELAKNMLESTPLINK